jgi:PAS domain S-box-containing protein
VQERFVHDDGERGPEGSPLTPAQLATIVAIAADAIIALDEAERIVFFNAGAERIFGYAAAEVLGQPLLVLLPERARSVHSQHIRAFAAAPESARLMGERMEIRGLRRGGVEFPAEASIAKIGEDDSLLFLVVLRDVTEQKRAQDALAERQRQLEDARRTAEVREAARAAAEDAGRRVAFLARASAELASSLDFESTLRTVARLAVPTIADWAAVDIVTPAGELERLAAEHVDPARVELVRELQRRHPPAPDAPSGPAHVIRTGETEYAAEVPDSLLETLASDAEHLALMRQLGLSSYVAAPLAARGRVLGVFTLVMGASGRRYDHADRLLAEDLARRAALAIENAELVSELQAAQSKLQEQAQELKLQTEELAKQNAELQQQATELKRLNRVRSDFMATVSHELRTPLNAIIGYSELLLEGIPAAIPEDAQQQVQRIRLGARHLLQLIDEILTFSSLEAGRDTVLHTDVRLRDLLDELQAIMEPLAGSRNLELRLSAAASLPETIRTDGNKLRQILLNLLGNAVKFTEQGRVELRVRSESDAVVFEVEDTGRGLTEDELKRLFEPFWQADQSLTRPAEGAGLGLAIAERMAYLLGGVIEVRSRPDHGSVFRLRLPA